MAHAARSRGCAPPNARGVPRPQELRCGRHALPPKPALTRVGADNVSEMELSEVFGESAPSQPDARASLDESIQAASNRNVGFAAAAHAPDSRQEFSNGAVLARLIEPHTRPRGDFEAQLLEAVRRLKAASPGAVIDAAPLTAHLASLGYAARAVQAGRSSVALSLKHTFVAVEHAGDDRADVIVEPHLRSHFQISRPSLLYSRLVEELPDEFVGSGDALSRLCFFIGDQMGTSFQEKGMTVPPWRNVHSLLTKWNLGDRGASPERTKPAPKPPTFARRSTDGSRSTTAAAAAAQAAQLAYGTAPLVPWASSR